MWRENLGEAAERAIQSVSGFGSGAALDPDGDPAFIVWDEDRRTLFAARDPMGAAGLFYRKTSEELRLAPRATDLLSSTPTPSELEIEGLVGHLSWKMPEAGSSYFKGVQQVPPGSILVARDSRVEVHSYWQPGLVPLRDLSDEEWEEALRSTLSYVLRDLLTRWESSKGLAGNLGLTLSAGLDSGSIAVTLAQALDEPNLVTAVRWAAPELPRSDESKLSAEVARRYGFADLEVRADQHWTFSPPLGAATEPDSPVAVPYVAVWEATFRAARTAGIRDLITGASGDHLLAGNIFADLDLLLTGRWLRAARSLADYGRTRRLGPAGMTRHLAQLVYWSGRAMLGRPVRRIPPWIHPSAKDLASSLISPAASPLRSLPGRRRHLELLRDPMRAETLRLLGLHAARHGVRLHHPLLDRRIFALSASIPSQQLFSHGLYKHVVRRAFRDTLPEAITASPAKILPTEIFHRGLREREVDRVRDLLTDMRAADLQLVEPATALQHYDSYLRGEVNDLSALWPTLTLETWLRQHVS